MCTYTINWDRTSLATTLRHFVVSLLAEELGTSSSITIPSGLVYTPIDNADLNVLCVCAQTITS